MHTIIVESSREAGIIGAALIAGRAHEKIHVAFPGGRSVVPIYEELSTYPASILENLAIRIGDERVSGEKNEDVIRNALITRELNYDFRTPLRGVDRDEIIRSYEESIDTDTFDVALLGTGEDGHVLGLFPGHPQLDSTNKVEAFTNSPKPPPDRMTTTYRCYDAKKTRAIILFLGDGKRDAYKRFLETDDYHEIPAAYFKTFDDCIVITDQHA